MGVLRPGNAQSTKWIVGLLQRMVAIIRKENPDIKIYFRVDTGDSRASLYALARCVGGVYAIGISKNKWLSAKVQEIEKHVSWQSFEYQVQHWGHIKSGWW